MAGTVTRFTDLLRAKGVRLLAVIDQTAEARQVGLDLRDTTLVIFGHPVAGTPVMDAAPLAALDLPLKVLIWDDAGQTKVTYVAPATLASQPAGGMSATRATAVSARSAGRSPGCGLPAPR